ncbi:lysophospholipid acyltransferase family protein [Butyrivibrio sp. VCD2006]|uniref:lysophospholipid acyltransferase family protein n=1 Tax=Butyrivibrio sp. VCD2006 TaxID=1280664 RepID=UPI0003FBC6C6|nr:lysophospholipid acyltransferase family protein [Butyrivibrio sp. VCD2006]
MKIKVIPKSFPEVENIKTYQNKKPCKQTAFWRFIMRMVAKKDLEDCHFSYETEGMEKLNKNEPCLILMNHSSSTDLEMVAEIFHDREFHIVTTLDGFIGKEWLMRQIGCIPARKFITDMPLIKDILHCLNDLKASVVMFPEASYSFDGTATKLPSSVGKCLKLFKVPVVMVTTTGSFHRDPLYNGLQKRDVTVSARVKYLLSPTDIKEKSVSELNDILKREFTFDHWRWQRENGIKVSEEFRADGLHRVLYKCPVCGKEKTLTGKGINLSCSFCKMVWVLTDDGSLVKQNISENEIHDNNSINANPASISQAHTTYLERNYDFSYISDWYRWERDSVKKEITEGKYYLDIPVDIIAVKDTKAAYRIGEGRLVHNINGFTLTGCNGELSYSQSPKHSYSLYADYFWYEIGDMISIGDMNVQYYCFPKDSGVNVAKVRLATEEIYKLDIPSAKKDLSTLAGL